MAHRMGAFSPQRLTRREVLAGSAALAVTCATGPLPASAGPASPWSDSTHSALRLLDGGPEGASRGEHLAAIALRLKPGFKTYWRHPGDSGVPPHFQFDGSANLREALVHFPAPRRFDDGAGGVSFGYVEPELLLPVTVVATDPMKKVLLRLKADYAVCEKLCVPASGVAELLLGGAPTAHRDIIRQAMQKVPRVVPAGAPGPVRILGLQRGTAAGTFAVEITAPDGEAAELFVEAPQPWFFEVGPVASGKSVIVPVKVVERPTPHGGVALTLTLVATSGAIEVRLPLDGALIPS